MKNLAKVLGVVVGVTFVAGFILYQFFPGTILSMLQTYQASNSGLVSRSVDLEGYTAHYYEGGNESDDVLVLLHGLIDNRNSFVPSVSELTKSYRVILPDLQGHGDNLGIESRDHSIKGQATFVKDLLNALNIQKAFVGGNSMGGHTATSFALNYPDKTRGLIVINATGLLLGRDSTYFLYPEDIDIEYMESLYAKFFLNPPSIPHPIKRYLANDLGARAPFFNLVVKQIEGGENFRLDEKLDSIVVPSLVLWGRHDPILPEIYAEGYHDRLADSSLKLVEAGHSPQLETPDIVQNEISLFLSGLSSP